ncbi:MAG: glycosyltransferase [Planctomycetales bacterium]|nr:glycosyltransferase [Planctomycetales bacterium]
MNNVHSSADGGSVKRPTDDSVDCPLTVVIIGKNEEQFIARSVASVIEATRSLPGAEIIYVDSASTDRSVECASKYPIRIRQLRPDWPLCVAAGRYTGYVHSHGRHIFFLDGDAEADPHWLAKAVRFLDDSPQYGAVAGVLDEEYMTREGVRVGGSANVFKQNLHVRVEERRALGGIALYRRESLERAGTVNPHLPTGEDDELCMRIRNAGWKVARLEGRMAVKYTEKRETLYEVLRRCRTSMYDYGAVIRYSSTYGAGWQYSREMIPYVLSFSAVIVTLLFALPAAIIFHKLWLLSLVLVAVIGMVVVKKGGLRDAMLSIAVRSVSTYRTAVSFCRTRPKPVEAYPTDVIVVQ